MSGVICVPQHDPWKIAGYEFRTLLERTQGQLEDPADVYAMTQAMALNGLHFDLMTQEQARRIAPVMARVSDELRWELESSPRDERDLGFARALAELEMLLHDVYE
jgi:hypothetical protein